MAPSLRRWLGNLLLLLGSALFTIIVLEFGLRITGLSDSRPTPPKIYQQSEYDEISYELKPLIAEKAFRNTVTTNSLGFRSQEVTNDKPLIAMLGDSVTFGYGLADDEAIGRRLEAKLPDVQVLNAAVPGYNLLQETATYEYKVARLKPSALIIVFNWNDLENIEPAVLSADGNLRLPSQSSQSVTCNPIEEGLLGMIPGRCWLDLHSALYRAVKKVVSRRTEQGNLAVQIEENKASPFREAVEPARLQLYASNLKRLTEALRPGMPRLFVIWPDKNLHFTYRPQLKKIAEAEGYRVLDLHEVFGNQAASLPWDTSHPSAETVDQAAAVVAAVMQEWNLLPAR